MLMRHLTIIILTLNLLSCGTSVDSKSSKRFFPITTADTILVYELFSITVPNSWRKPNDDTLPKMTDATVHGRIQIGEDEFIWYSNGLGASDYSNYPEILPTADRNMYVEHHLDTSYVIFSDNPKSVDTTKLNIHRVWMGNIEGHRTKFFAPRKDGFGHTGIFMDSIGEIKGVANLRFSMYANKLDSLTNAAFIKSLTTIKNFKAADF